MGKQSRRRCRFCSQEGSSREHIIAQWIGRALTPDPRPGVTVVFQHRTENPEAGIAERLKPAKAPAFFTLAFCEPCNNGWLSRLEDRVRPALEPLILGLHPRVITPAEQELLAFWALKTILAFQTIEDETTKFARDADFKSLYQTRAPLPYAQVWLGASKPADPAWYRAHSSRLRDAGEKDIAGFGATLTVGHAVFYTLIGYGGALGMRLRYDAANALKEIWPLRRYRDLRWPPPLGLNEAQPQALAETLARSCVILGSAA